jgi:hypothetical protein
VVKFLDVEFDSIGKTRVYVPPNNLIYRILEKKYPYPPVPEVTEETAHGKTVTMEIADDPDYLAEKESVDETRREAHKRYQFLLTFKDLKVPEGWPDDDFLEMIRILDPEWKPERTTDALKLQYIEHVVFWDPTDESKFEIAMNEMLGLDLELAAFFRGRVPSNVEGAPPPPLAEPTV